MTSLYACLNIFLYLFFFPSRATSVTLGRILVMNTCLLLTAISVALVALYPVLYCLLQTQVETSVNNLSKQDFDRLINTEHCSARPLPLLSDEFQSIDFDSAVLELYSTVDKTEHYNAVIVFNLDGKSYKLYIVDQNKGKLVHLHYFMKFPLSEIIKTLTLVYAEELYDCQCP